MKLVVEASLHDAGPSAVAPGTAGSSAVQCCAGGTTGAVELADWRTGGTTGALAARLAARLTPAGSSPVGWPSRVRVLIYSAHLRQVLLVHAAHRANSSRTGRWWSPGGGVNPGESCEHAAVREVKEETGLELLASGLEHVGCIGRGGGQQYFCYDFGPSFPGLIRTLFWQRRYNTGWREVDDVWWGSWEEAVTYDGLHQGTMIALQWLADIRGWTSSERMGRPGRSSPI